MGANRVAAVRASLDRLSELGLKRPTTLGIKEWLAELAGQGLLDRDIAKELGESYDSMRFGGKPIDEPRWTRLEEALESVGPRFEGLDPLAQKSVVSALPKPVPRRLETVPSPPSPRSPAEARAGDDPREKGVASPPANSADTSSKMRWAILAACIGGVVGAGLLYKHLKADSPPPTRSASSPAATDVDLMKPSATADAGIFRKRLALPGHRGRAVSLVDYDGDGDLDIFLALDAGLRLLEKRDSKFIDVTRAVGLTGPARSGQWADVDGDGDLDLAVTASHRPPVLFRREGAAFVASPLPFTKRANPEGLGWIDFDADGDPDLLVTNGEFGVHLFENDGGSLNDISPRVGFGPEGWGRHNGDFVHFLELDADGRVDILYAAKEGLAARNVDGSRFEAMAVAIDFGIISGTQKHALAVGDIDGDRVPEVFVPQRNGATLYKKTSGEFAPVETPELTRALGSSARTAVFGDLDLDGDLDLLVSLRGGGLAMFENRAGTLYPSTAEAALAELTSDIEILGMALGDIDRDGDPDLVFHALRGSGGILINTTDRPPPGRGLLRATFAKPPVPGTRISVRAAGESTWQTRWLLVPSNSGSQQPIVSLFSLPMGQSTVEIKFTDGTTRCAIGSTEPEWTALVTFDMNNLGPCTED